jgi:CDP-diacylglycerol--glycerol-3-phosphate 3-phosphatidyltransferase
MEQDRVAGPALDLRWTLSNALSAVRMVLVLPMAYTLTAGVRWATITLCILAAVTDVLDGYFARRFNEISDLGKILDPLADKVFVGVLVILMLIEGMLPLWFVAVVLGRDLVIFLGGIIIERRTGKVLPSNYPGKIAVLILSATLLVIIIGVPQIAITVMMAISLALLALSLFLYTKRGIETGMRG